MRITVASNGCSAAFAADVSAKVQMEGSLFDYGFDKSVSGMQIGKPAAQHWNPIFNLSMNGDTAGAEFCVFTGGAETYGGWNQALEAGANRFKIWMSPFDGFKFIYGLNGFKLNEEHITWSKSDSGAESYGYSINYSANGFALDVALLPGWDTPWMKKGADGKINLSTTAIKAQYGADFGTINAVLVGNSTFKDIKFGAAYANNFNGISVFANFLGYVNNGFNKVQAELYVDGNANGFGYQIFPVFAYKLNPGANELAFNIPLWAKFYYGINGITAYLEIDDPQGLLRVGTSLEGVNDEYFIAKLGANGNIGGAGWDICAKIHINEGVAFSIPVTFNMAW